MARLPSVKTNIAQLQGGVLSRRFPVPFKLDDGTEAADLPVEQPTKLSLLSITRPPDRSILKFPMICYWSPTR
jgi:hypothetical protein